MVSLCKFICIKKFILFIEGSIRFKLGTVLISNLESFSEAPLMLKNSSLHIQHNDNYTAMPAYKYATLQIT
jgi:hypothetical protein